MTPNDTPPLNKGALNTKAVRLKECNAGIKSYVPANVARVEDARPAGLLNRENSSLRQEDAYANEFVRLPIFKPKD